MPGLCPHGTPAGEEIAEWIAGCGTCYADELDRLARVAALEAEIVAGGGRWPLPSRIKQETTISELCDRRGRGRAGR